MYQIIFRIDQNFLCDGLTDPSGKVHPEITNKNGNPNYKYFYSNADQGDIPFLECDITFYFN